MASENYSIRERIERRAVLVAADVVGGVGNVHRWDQRGETDWQTTHAYIYDEGEEYEYIGGGVGGYVQKALTLVVVIPLVYNAGINTYDDLTGTSDLVNAYRMELEKAFAADGAFTELDDDPPYPPTYTLDSWHTVSPTDGIEYLEGRAHAAVRVVIYYKHERANPDRYGSAIPVKARA